MISHNIQFKGISVLAPHQSRWRLDRFQSSHAKHSYERHEHSEIRFLAKGGVFVTLSSDDPTAKIIVYFGEHYAFTPMFKKAPTSSENTKWGMN